MKKEVEIQSCIYYDRTTLDKEIFKLDTVTRSYILNLVSSLLYLWGSLF